MSTDEIVEQAIQGHASTRDAIRWAIQQELEACAKICDAADKSTHPAELADAIRARSLK
jgi:3-methyladenine DNA glycosylase AlkC